MAFSEVRVNDGLIIYATEGGSAYSTDIVVLNSGYEARNQNWVNSRGQWNLGDRTATQSEVNVLNAFFRARKGRSVGFRFKDYQDYQDGGSGILATQNQNNIPTGISAGTGMPTYQMFKTYNSGADTEYRMIRKPVAGTVVAIRNGSPVVYGGGAGQVALDSTAGLITFNADASSGVTVLTTGTTTQVTLTTNPNSLVAGKFLYLNGFAGVDAAVLNAQAFNIVSVTGTGPFVFTLAVNTTAKNITLGVTLGYAFPQASDTLTWTGQFDVPVRFDTDNFMARFDGAHIVQQGVVQEGYFYISRLSIVEVRV